jgi:phosphatidylinositol-3-phosphatase
VSRRPALAAAALVLAVVCAACGHAAARPDAPPALQPCGTGSTPPRTYAHVIWIWMENHALDDVVGSSAAPFVDGLTRSCGLATHYSAVAHPSLPNYVAATSGGTQAVVDDAGPSRHRLAVRSIFEQARSAGSFVESMPALCSLADAGDYAVRHNPQTYYTRVRAACRRRDVPLGTPTAGPLAHALDHGTLPAFSFVTPNLCNDMHDCGVAAGDAWLARWVTRIVRSPAYRRGRTVLFVTWDEGDSDSNLVPSLVIAPTVRPGTRSAVHFSHYSLLRTTEELLGIRELLGAAATAPSMRTAFRL